MEEHFEMMSDSGELVAFRERLRPLLSASGLDEKAAGEVLVAVQEVLANIVRHAYAPGRGKIRVDLRAAGDRVTLSICDYGKKFDLTQMPDPELPKQDPGGLGVYLVKQLMDEVRYDDSFREGNLLHLTKRKRAA
jgi:serine/threonine-protein kinase RsbW